MDNLGSSSFILTFLLGGTILIGLFIILILLKSKSLKTSRFFLAAMLFFLLLYLETFLLFTTQIIKQLPNLLGIGYPTLFLLGPAFYFFIISFNKENFRFKKLAVLHLIPFVIILIIQMPFYFESLTYKQAVIDYYYKNLPTNEFALNEWFRASMHMLLLLIYTIISLRYLNKKDKTNSLILKKISWALIILSVSYIVLQTGFLITGISAIIAEIVLGSILAITILLLGYWIVDIKAVLSTYSDKYKTSPLSEKKVKEIEDKLMKTLSDERLYLNPKLKIRDLSTVTGIPSHHISQVLNERMRKSFYDFINDYRINDAKIMLLNGIISKLSIQAVGEECGFSNKTSFYRAFKKNTGTTPNEFMKNKAG